MRKQVDWESVELHYRAGIRSLKDIGLEFDVSDAAIIKRAKRDSWERDLTSRIQQKAQNKVSASVVSAEVSALTKVRENDIVEANATMQANVIIAHRTDVGRYRDLASSLFKELAAQTDCIDLLEQLGELLYAPDDKGTDKRNELYRKIIDSPVRIESFKKLTETFKTLIALERQAFGLDKEIKNTNTLEDYLSSL